MSTFASILNWELGLTLRRISIWVYFLIFFAIGFGLMTAAGGTWESVGLVLASGGKVRANSPFSLQSLITIIGVFGIVVTAATAGNAAVRDYETGIYPLFFTTPVSKGSFLGGRFVGVVLVNLIIFASIGLGCLAATAMPWMDAEKLVPFSVLPYAQSYFAIVLPNVLLLSAIFFALGSTTRQMLPNYIAGVVLLVGYLIAGQFGNEPEWRGVAALADPFGGRAMGRITEYWTIAEKNSRVIPLEGVLLANRLIWLTVALVVFILVYRSFQFAQVGGEGRIGGAFSAMGRFFGRLAFWQHRVRRAMPRPAVAHRSFGAAAQLAQFWSITSRSFWSIVKNRYFFAIVCAGLLFLGFTTTVVGKLYGTVTYPVTYEVLSLLGGSFALFVLIVITFYSGELVWQERELKIAGIQDAAPTRVVTTYLAKLAALIGVEVLLLLVVLVAGIVTQTLKGYHRYEIGLYLQSLFGIQLIDYVLLAVLALTLHTLINHKYIAHFIIVLFYIGNGLLGQLGLEHGMFQYGSDGGTTYSDMNGYGHFLYSWKYWKLYWSGFAILLATASVLFLVRGAESGWKGRVRIARQRFGRGAKLSAALGALTFAGAGSFIFYNTNILNDFHTQKYRRQQQARYERQYKKYEHFAQPRITAVTVAVDLDPVKRAADVRGSYMLRNKTSRPIDSVIVQTSPSLEIRELTFARPATRVHADSALAFYIWRLATPLAPGDSIAMTYHVWHGYRGFENTVDGTDLVANGTFVSSAALLPSIGYSANAELADDDSRKKVGLKPRARMAPPTDSVARRNSYISSDADWIDFDATVSTVPDQIAIAPGYLQREWTENGRRYFHYKMDAPILNFVAFLSARYAVKKDHWTAPAHDGRPPQDVAIEIYYQPGHEYNLDRMIRGVKRSLDYYSAAFSPYQHRQVRILEFPRYAQFAQSFPNMIPFSEGIGFIARLEKPTDIDYPFYVTAHEVAHQWWAHQVIGANTQGSTMLVETMAQYSALMVMEKEYGRDKMRRFLEYELDQYLIGRALERKKEQPLAYNENQQYIHYRKGSLVMYALRDYLGEERLNAALSRYLMAVRYQEPPYTTSLEMLDTLRAATPDSLKYLYDDLFTHITLYELRTDSAAATKRADGKWDVTMTVTAKKLRADSLGNEKEQPMGEWIDVGVFADSTKTKEDIALYLAKQRIVAGKQRITVTVDREPARAGIDPLHKLIDRKKDDNTIKVDKPGPTAKK